MLNLSEYLHLSAGLISVVNPIGIIPTFITLTSARTNYNRKRTALVFASSFASVLCQTSLKSFQKNYLDECAKKVDQHMFLF